MKLDRRGWLAVVFLALGLACIFLLLCSLSARAETGETSSTPTGEIAAGTVGGSSVLAGVVSFYTSRIQTNRRVDCIEKKIMVVMGALRFTSPEAQRYIDSMEPDIPLQNKK